MHHSLIKKIVLLSMAGFFLAILAVAFHHHDRSFLLASCSICKVKTSISGSFNKNNIDSPPAVAVIPSGVAAIFFSSTMVVPETTTILISSQVAYIYPNKAPPARS
ncbi:MAG: hypothetical protein WC405_06685 [Syntrophales bacterium]